jgi:DNA-binding LacI/PurR family transcriptional regulator
MYPVATRLPAVRELATEFGVATATVTRALKLLTDAGLVERRERSGVFVLAKPAEARATLDPERSGLIGFIAFDTVVSPYWSVVVNEIEQAVRTSDYHLVLGNSNLDVDQAIDYVRSFARMRVDGIIFVPFDAADRETYERANGAVVRELRASGLPYVLYDRTISDRHNAPATVGIDNAYYAEMLAKRLVSAGFRRPLAVSVSHSSSIGAREAAFSSRFPDAAGDGRLVRLPTRRVTDEHLSAIAAAVDRDDVDSLFLINSSVLNGYLRAREAGLIRRLPSDAPYVAFEDFPVRGSEGALARVVQAIRPLARAAADVCIDRVEHRSDTWGTAHIDVRLPCQLVPSGLDHPSDGVEERSNESSIKEGDYVR